MKIFILMMASLFFQTTNAEELSITRKNAANELIKKSPEVRAFKRSIDRAVRTVVGPELAPIYLAGKIAIDGKIAYRYEIFRAEYDFKREQVSLQMRIDF